MFSGLFSSDAKVQPYFIFANIINKKDKIFFLTKKPIRISDGL
jgi:hypothetical protein